MESLSLSDLRWRSSSNPVVHAEIIVVSHGQTDWDVDGRVPGQLDVELNDVGREQALKVANRLSREFLISRVYSSDLKRDMETARLIATRCGCAEVIEEQDLRERHYGDLQGLKYLEFATLKPEACRAFMLDQEIPGGGESIDQFRQRCISCLQRIGCKHRGEQVVVVTDYGVIKKFIERSCTTNYFPVNMILPDDFPMKMTLNTSVSIFLLSGGVEWILKKYYDDSHLSRPTEFFDIREFSCNSKKKGGLTNRKYVEIIVVRNGETAWDNDGRVEGQLNVELNDNGRQQAIAVAERLCSHSYISCVYTSDLKSAVDTTNIIAMNCGHPEVIVDRDLREKHYGDLQGFVEREFATVRPEAYKDFISIGNTTNMELPGGGESHDKFCQRLRMCISKIIQKHKGEAIVVVTHLGVIKALYALSYSNDRHPGKIPNTSVSEFLGSDGGVWVLKLWHNVCHLHSTRYLK